MLKVSSTLTSLCLLEKQRWRDTLGSLLHSPNKLCAILGVSASLARDLDIYKVVNEVMIVALSLPPALKGCLDI